ncbi:DUF1735 and LamG domain-containing protein [Prevotella sp.]|uniref:DUF1735 and LamG domain-containing protein n=1 Tax=Prevotella sp. TaxID=59823 RepID=UPI002F940BA5
MKIKYSFLSAAWLLGVCGALFTSCNSEGDSFDYGKKGIFVTGADVNPLQTFAVEDTPSEYPISVKATHKATTDVHLKLAIDPSLVEQYNTKNKASFYPIPKGAVELLNPDVTIKANSAVSTVAAVKLVSTENFEEGRTYVIPVTIASTDGSEDLIEGAKTIYLKVSRTMKFPAIVNNPNASSCFIFDKSVRLTTFTYQIKFYSDSWGGMHRLCNFSQKDESKQSMLRWGEGNFGADVLQWVNAGPAIVSKTHFQPKRWYMLSLQFDGSTYRLFVDGVEDANATGTLPDGFLDFQRFEMGMSWGGYRSRQFFPGRFCEVRVWSRALSATEIAAGLCAVDPKAEGLEAYWKFNENSGHVFHDATKKGFDMDWTNTWRDDRENGQLINHDYSSAIQWVMDDANKCVQ